MCSYKFRDYPTNDGNQKFDSKEISINAYSNIIDDSNSMHCENFVESNTINSLFDNSNLNCISKHIPSTFSESFRTSKENFINKNLIINKIV